MTPQRREERDGATRGGCRASCRLRRRRSARAPGLRRDRASRRRSGSRTFLLFGRTVRPAQRRRRSHGIHGSGIPHCRRTARARRPRLAVPAERSPQASRIGRSSGVADRAGWIACRSTGVGYPNGAYRWPAPVRHPLQALRRAAFGSVPGPSRKACLLEVPECSINAARKDSAAKVDVYAP